MRSTTFVYLVSKVWPMGYSWSSIMAQNCMLAICRGAMLTNEKCLSVDLPLPKCLSESFDLATDDICHFTTGGMMHAEEVGYRIDRALLSQPSDQTSYWCSGWYMRRNRSFSRHVFLVHRCTNLYRFCTRRPCWLIPTRQLKSLLVAVLPFWSLSMV